MAFLKWGKTGFNHHARIVDMDFDGVEAAFLNWSRRVRGSGAAPQPSRGAIGERERMALKIERFQPEGMNVRMSGGNDVFGALADRRAVTLDKQ